MLQNLSTLNLVLLSKLYDKNYKIIFYYYFFFRVFPKLKRRCFIFYRFCQGIKLKNKFTSETKKFQKIEESIKKDESELILQKKIISAEDYKKKVATLRKKVSDLQKNRQKSFSSIAKSRDLAKQNLLKAVNPIIKKYMTDNKIRIILNKKEVIMGDTSLEITSQIITILNKEFPAIKIN